MIQVMDSSKRMRVTMARAKPKKRVFGCIAFGIRLTRIEIMMMLSIPKTISNTVRVKNAIQISGLRNHSITSKLSIAQKKRHYQNWQCPHAQMSESC
ncbi:hypothetical protein D3C78_1321880 [compost metagenome]